MERQNKIARSRYALEALGKIPQKDFKKACDDVKKILGITSRQQLLTYRTGVVKPDMGKVKALEDYFKTKWGIEEVWKEVETTTVH